MYKLHRDQELHFRPHLYLCLQPPTPSPGFDLFKGSICFVSRMGI